MNSNNNLTNDFAYVLGVVYGDGHCRSRGRTHEVTLGVKDKDFALKFKGRLDNWSGKQAKYFLKHGFYSVALYSKEYTNLILNFDINNILTSDDKIKINFLGGMFDSEGGIIGHNLKNRKYAKRWIHFSNNNKKIIDLITSLLDQFKIKYTLNSRIHSGFGSKKLQYEITTYGLRNLVWFHTNKIFSINRKVNKLKEVIDSYNYYSRSLFNQAKELHKEMGYKKVADKIGLPKGVVYGWLFKNNQKQILGLEV